MARAKWRALYAANAPRIIASIAAILGLLTLVEALLADQRHRVHAIAQVIPVPASAAAAAVIFVSGVLLLRLAAGLRKRKRLAWQLAVAITFVMTVAHVIRAERRYGEATISLVLLIMLLTGRASFTARSDPHSRWFALRVLIQSVLFTVALGLAMTYFSGQAVGQPSFVTRLNHVLLAMVGTHGQVRFHREGFADAFAGTLFGLSLIIAATVVLLVLRPSEPIAGLSADDAAALRKLLHTHGGRDSLGYFALRDDKSVVWSPTGKAAITYRVVLGVALASGDPIGDPEAWPGAIAAFRELVESYAWTPAVMGCSELGATVFKREYDLSAIELGDEAVVDVEDFTLDGRAMRGVRQACARAERAGYHVRVRRAGEIGAAELADLRQLADRWRGDAVERGFSMALSRFGDAADPDCVVVTACHEGRTAALLHFVPWGRDGLSLDLMRRDRASENGLNEYVIARLLVAAQEFGVRRVSLNFAVFRDALERGERIGAGPMLRAWRGVLLLASRWWQIQTLYRFNVKFRPYWEPRFISYAAARDLPRIGVAALEAEAFLVRPHGVKALLGRA